MTYLAFYKGNYKWYSRLIRWWTNSKYSHCEFYVDGYLVGISSDELAVRKKKQRLNTQKWDIYKLDIDEAHVEKFFTKTQGKKYDWLGIILNLRKGDKDKYTCSEWVAQCLDEYYDCFFPKRYIEITPQDIYELKRSKKCL